MRVVGDLQLTDETSIAVEIIGPSGSPANSGRVDVTGTLTKNGALNAAFDLYTPITSDSYDVITCTDCTAGTFASTLVSPLEVTTTLTTVTLALAPTGPCTTTWTGAAGNGIFTDPGNWTGGVPDGADVACLDGTPAETITIPSGESVDVLRFESAGQSLVIDGSLTVNELSTLDGQITVNGSLNGVGDIVIADFAEVSGTITGLVTVANGAQLFFLDGAISGASTVLTNLGVVVVSGPGLLLANGVTVDNSGLWEFFTGDTSGDGNVDQTLLISVPDSSTFNNDGVVRKVGDGLTVLQGGFEFNMGDGSAIVVAEGELRLFADGTWTGDSQGIDVQSEIDTTFVWAGNQTVSGGIAGTSSVDAVGKVVMSGTKTWAVPGGDEPRTNTLDFGHDPTAPASANYQLDLAAVTFLGEPFDIDGFARFIGGTTTFQTDAAINADIAVILLSRVTIDNGVTVTIRGDVELDGSIRTEESFDNETIFLNSGVLVFDTESGPIDVSGSGRVENGGEVRTFGTDTTTVGPGVTWRSSSSGSLLVDEGELALSGPVVYLDETDEPGLSGYTFLGAGALLTVDGDLVLDVDSFLEIGINGPPTDASNYGRLSVGGTLTKGGGLSASGIQGSEPDYAPTVDDVFPIITCTDCYPGSFDFFGTGPLDAVPTATAITLQIVANKINQPIDSSGYRFGSDIDIDGNWAVVSAPAGSGDDGGLFVYELVAGEWTLDQVLVDSTNPGLGASIALDGNYLAATTDGPVRIWSRTAPGTNFTPLGAGILPAGTSVSIDRNTLIVGDSAAAVPEARVYDLVSSGSLLATLIPDGSIPVATFGDAVAVFDGPSGDGYAAVGARSNSGAGAGAVYTFERSGGSWNAAPDEILISPDGGAVADNIAEQPRGQFGNAVAIDGETLVVAEFLNSATAGDRDAGAAWVYSGVPGGFSAPVRIVASDGGSGDVFGTAVDVDGDVIIVGAGASQETNVPYRAGAAYVFNRTGASWTEREVLRAADRFDGERFGDAVAVSGANALVGAPFDTNGFGFGGGAAYSYDVTPPEPTVPTFVGVGMSSWTNPANWSTGVVPGAGDEAVVPLGAMAFVDGADAVDIGSLTVAGELFVFGELTVLAPSTIDATGVLWVENGARTALGGATLVVDGQLVIRSAALVDLSNGASVDGSGLVANSGAVVKTAPVASSIGADITWSSGIASVLRVAEGLLDVESTAFDAQGGLVVEPGAQLRFQNDLTLTSTSLVEFQISGPSTDPDNSGRLLLQTGTLNADGTLRATVVGGYDATFDDLYSVVACPVGSCLGSPFVTLDVSPLTVSSTTDSIVLRGPEFPVALSFDLDVAPGSDTELPVATSGIAVNTIDRNAVARSGGGTSSVAASSISSIGPEDTSLASITLADTPMRSIILESAPLSSIPLVNIDIDGGWDDIIRGNPELEKEPLSSLTFGQVLDEGDPADPTTPAGRLVRTELQAINVEGTPLRSIPLAAIALGDTALSGIDLPADGSGANPWCAIIGDLAAGYESCNQAIDDLTLIEITLRGIAVESIPMRSIPMRSILVESAPMRSILLQDISLAASPVGSIPMRSIVIADTPMRSIPMRSIPVTAVPASAIEFDRVVQVDEGSGLVSTPMRSIEIAGTPMRSIGTSIVLDPAPVRAIDAEGNALSSIQIPTSEIGSIPVAVIALADVPLDEIPLREGDRTLEWCDVLADIDAGYDCSSGVIAEAAAGAAETITTFGELTLRGVPMRSIPLESIPMRSIDLQASPMRSIPMRSIPMRSIAVGAISLEDTALGAIELGATPMRSIPMRSIDLRGTALGSIPLNSIDIDGGPTAIPMRSIPMRSIPMRSIPMRSIPLESIVIAGAPMRSIPMRSIDIAGSPMRSIPLRLIDPTLLDCSRVDCALGTLGTAYTTGAISGDVTLEQIQDALASISLYEFAEALIDAGPSDVLVALEAAGVVLGDLSSLDGLTLADLPRGTLETDWDALGLGRVLRGVPDVSIIDLLDALLDPQTGRPLSEFDRRTIENEFRSVIDGLTVSDGGQDRDLQLGDLSVLGDLTLDDLFSSNYAVTLGDIEPVLRFVTVDALRRALGLGPNDVVVENLLLQELSAQQIGQLTLADLKNLGDGPTLDIGVLVDALGLSDQIDGLTLGDLLLALVDPGSLSYGGIEFVNVDTDALPDGTVGTTTFAADFTLTASTPRPVTVEVDIPASASFVPGSGALADGTGTPIEVQPDIDGDSLSWTFTARPGTDYSVEFDVLPTLRLGPTSIEATARVVGTDISVPASAAVTVVEGSEVNDFIPDGRPTTPAFEDFVYLTYIASETDIDVYQVDVARGRPARDRAVGPRRRPRCDSVGFTERSDRTARRNER